MHCMLFDKSMSETQTYIKSDWSLREGCRVVQVSLNVFFYADHSQVGLLDGHNALAVLSLGSFVLQSSLA